MKYFTKELWNSINADDISVRNDALKEWEKRTEEYLCAFNKVKAKFPKTFLKVYDQNEGFHDYKLESITFKLKRKKYIVKLHLRHGKKNIILVLSDVKRLSTDFSLLSVQNCICGEIAWGYAELDYSSNGLFIISILFDCENEMMNMKKRISIMNKAHDIFSSFRSI